MKNNNGFTLVEILISSVVISLVVIVLIMVFRSNLHTFQWGQKHMGFNQHVQLVMRQIFTDLKNINPILTQDIQGHLLIAGERSGDLRANMVTILNHHPESENKNDELSFVLTTFSDINRRDHVRYYVDPETTALIREVTDNRGNVAKREISPLVRDFSLKNDPFDRRQIRVGLTIINEDDETMKDQINFAVRLQTDLVGVREIRANE